MAQPNNSKIKIKDGVWKQLLQKAHGLDKKTVKVGVLASKGGDAAHDESGITLIELAAIHEFGSPAANIPERSFIRRTFATKHPELVDLVSKLTKQIVMGTMDVDKALAILGQWGAAEVKKTITEGEGVPPPLAPATIAAKNSSRPLVDTGRLLNSIQWVIVDGKPEGGI